MKEEIEKLVVEKYGKGYLKAFTFTMSAEGGFANHIDDRGGMTWCGITRVFASKWKGWQVIDRYLENYKELSKPSKQLNKDLVKKLNAELSRDKELEELKLEFYFENYYKRVKADIMPNKVGVILFDMCVLQGVNRANKTLQKLCNRYFGKNLLVDGIIGSETLTTIENILKENGADIFASELLHEYTDNLIEASKYGNNTTFLNGWMNRVNNLRNYLRLLK